MRHINTSAIIDLLLRLITTTENNDLRQQINQWLKRTEIISHLIDLFQFKYSSVYHSNTSQLICDIIRLSREQILNIHEQIIENKNSSSSPSSSSSENMGENNKNTNEIISNLYENSLLEEIES